MSKQKDELQSIKQKGKLTLGAVAFAALWGLLWFMFPMEWYAIFFDSIVGSFIQLAMIAAILSPPLCNIFSYITGYDISFAKTLTANIICLTGVSFIYSFHSFVSYGVAYLVFAILFHFAVILFIFAPSKAYDIEVKLTLKEKKPVMTVLWAVFYTAAANFINILLLRIIFQIFRNFYNL